MGVYYSLAVWRFKPILSAGLRFHSHLSGILRLRNYRVIAGNHKFSSRFSVFACFCGRYSNRVKRLRRLSGNFILLKASLFNKGLPFRARPSQSGLPSVSPAKTARYISTPSSDYIMRMMLKNSDLFHDTREGSIVRP